MARNDTICGARVYFATPANLVQPYFLYNVKGLTLKNVTVAGQVHNTTLSG